ncbi:MAG: aminoacyl-tRNA hydrolase [Prochlorococcus sp. SP3034]|nr:aminoacyl-tRNA hydrolase [Prochlorococcus sp. SP3034]|tara:strand:- start:1693 stop:2304 length:612 start_codon:yes stop_codon:yes gene_type:complete
MSNKYEKFIIGLGNPEKKYSNTRHNIGFLLIEELLAKYGLKITLKNKFKSFYSEYKCNEIKYNLFMPNTYMNNSGDAIRAIINWYGIELNQLLIIVDDIDIPLGKIRFRKRGGSGGHNGLKSIINALNTEDFKRIRVGIGSPPSIRAEKEFNTISHVLGKISKEENKIFKNVFSKIIESIEKLNLDNEDSIISELNSFKPFNH